MAGIYIHIPFCKQACNYCNFHFSTSLKYKNEMIEAIKKELLLRKDYLQDTAIETIYLGGGTPSLLNEGELMSLFETIFNHYQVNQLREVTLEANPDDLNNAYLKMLGTTPVNRLSIGIQSFREEDLRYMNRAHNAAQADYAIKAAQDQGLDNMSIDLIYGTPGLDNAHWKKNMLQAIGYGVPHISSYALTVEPQTALAHSIAKKKSAPVSTEQQAQQFELLMETLPAAGYEHYEISNFALPGKYALHNTNYWRGVHYLGIGPSAHSFNGRSRQWNVANNARYMKALLQDGKPDFDIEMLSDTDQANEYVMTSLRTMWGLDLAYYAEKFGSEAQQLLLQGAQEALLEGKVLLLEDHLRLTAAGKLFADGIAADLFVDSL